MTNENPLSAVSSDLTLFDDDRLIHKLKPRFSTTLLAASPIEVFIFAAGLQVCLSGGRVVFTTGGCDSSKNRECFSGLQRKCDHVSGIKMEILT